MEFNLLGATQLDIDLQTIPFLFCTLASLVVLFILIYKKIKNEKSMWSTVYSLDRRLKRFEFDELKSLHEQMRNKLNNPTIKFIPINSNVMANVIPKYGSDEAAGIDISSAVDATVEAKSWLVINTGYSVQIPKGYELQCRSRSGLAAKNGISVLNSPGTIDSDYQGEVKVILMNNSLVDFNVNQGDRIAQLVLSKVYHPDIEIAPTRTDNATPRGDGGFGSTGV